MILQPDWYTGNTFNSNSFQCFANGGISSGSSGGGGGFSGGEGGGCW